MARPVPVPRETQSDYNRAVAAARARAFEINRQQYGRLLDHWARAVLNLERAAEEGRVTAERAEALRRQLHATMDGLREQVNDTVETAVRLTVEDLVGIHARSTRTLLARHGMAGVQVQWDVLPARVYAVLAARTENAATFKSLVNYRFRLAVGEADALVDSAVLRGVSAGQLTRDLAQGMAGPELSGRLPSARRLHRGGLGLLDYRRYGVAPGDVAQWRKLLYDARRIAVSEPNNAMREANAQAQSASPIVRASKWQFRPGIACAHCMALGSGVFYRDMPPGYHPPERWPQGPHPFCGCCQGGPVLFRPVSEWATPKGPPPQPLEEAEWPNGALDALSGKVRGRASGLVKGTTEIAKVHTI